MSDSITVTMGNKTAGAPGDKWEVVDRIVGWRRTLKLGDAASQLVVMAGEVGELAEADYIYGTTDPTHPEYPHRRAMLADAVGDVAVTAVCAFDAVSPQSNILDAAGVIINLDCGPVMRCVIAQGRLAEAIRKKRTAREVAQLAKSVFVYAMEAAEEGDLDFWSCLSDVVKVLEARLAEGMVVVDGTAIKKSDQPNMVVSPPHYKDAARVECITIIEDLNLGFNTGNAMKYLWRAGRKGEAAKLREDLEKARWYVDREVAMQGGESWNAKAPTLGTRRS